MVAREREMAFKRNQMPYFNFNSFIHFILYIFSFTWAHHNSPSQEAELVSGKKYLKIEEVITFSPLIFLLALKLFV